MLDTSSYVLGTFSRLLEEKTGEKQNFSLLEESIANESNRLGIEFERQKPIGKYFADFYYPQNNLVLEIDGKEFHSTSKQIDHDNERDDFMNKRGYIVVRVAGRMVKDYAPSIVKICTYIPKDKVGTYYISNTDHLKSFWEVIALEQDKQHAQAI